MYGYRNSSDTELRSSLDGQTAFVLACLGESISDTGSKPHPVLNISSKIFGLIYWAKVLFADIFWQRFLFKSLKVSYDSFRYHEKSNGASKLADSRSFHVPRLTNSRCPLGSCAQRILQLAVGVTPACNEIFSFSFSTLAKFSLLPRCFCVKPPTRVISGPHERSLGPLVCPAFETRWSLVLVVLRINDLRGQRWKKEKRR